MTAGVFRFSLLRFMLAIVVGTRVSFLLEGLLAVRYGAEAKEILAKYYPWIGLGLAVRLCFCDRRCRMVVEGSTQGNRQDTLTPVKTV